MEFYYHSAPKRQIFEIVNAPGWDSKDTERTSQSKETPSSSALSYQVAIKKAYGFKKSSKSIGFDHDDWSWSKSLSC